MGTTPLLKNQNLGNRLVHGREDQHIGTEPKCHAKKQLKMSA